MTAKEKLRERIECLSEHEAELLLPYVDRVEAEPDVVGRRAGWDRTATGEPMPNGVAAVRRVRDEY